MPNIVATEDQHRQIAISINNSTWNYITKPDRTANDDEAMIRSAYAAAYHWAFAAQRTDANEARAEWMLSRVHVISGHGETALRHAQRSMAVVTHVGLTDFDLAYAHEALARSLACLSRDAEARLELAAAKSIPISDPEDKTIFGDDLASEPWFGLK